jgi:ATP-dependent exoDNAse (exonuclease V) alpha subunit
MANSQLFLLICLLLSALALLTIFIKRSKWMSQREALEILKLGHNVFLTGPAGSGKTHVLTKYLDYLKKNYVAVGVTASTGIAATHINGTTIHSWSGIKIDSELTDEEIKELATRPYLQKNFEANILVIDEISMLDAKRFDLVNRVCKAFKNNSLSFGGMQIVLCGDFFQLPPVSDDENNPAEFAYKSKSWKEAGLRVCYLGKHYRQKDKSFIRALSDIRNSTVGQPAVTAIRSRLNEKLGDDVVTTKLYPTNREIDTINYAELAALPGPEKKYEMKSRGSQLALINQLRNNCLAPELLRLKENAVVMFVKNNFRKKYANGTLGKVVGFNDDDFPLVRMNSGKVVVASPEKWSLERDGHLLAEIEQVPLRLAWAITIHKSQGMSLDAAEMDLSGVFEDGMGYVALSRVRSLKAISLLGIRDHAYQVSPEVLHFDQELIRQSTDAKSELRMLGYFGRKKLQRQRLARLLIKTRPHSRAKR